MTPKLAMATRQLLRVTEQPPVCSPLDTFRKHNKIHDDSEKRAPDGAAATSGVTEQHTHTTAPELPACGATPIAHLTDGPPRHTPLRHARSRTPIDRTT